MSTWVVSDSDDSESEGYGNEGNSEIEPRNPKKINSIGNINELLKFNMNKNIKTTEVDYMTYLLNSKSMQREKSTNISSHDFAEKNVVYLKIMNINHVLPTCHYIEVIANSLHNHMCINNYESENLIATIPGSKIEGDPVDMSKYTYIYEKHCPHQPIHIHFQNELKLHIKMINITQGPYSHLEGEALEIYPNMDKSLLTTSENSYDHYMLVLLKVGILKL
jgi:hypothetical protein